MADLSNSYILKNFANKLNVTHKEALPQLYDSSFVLESFFQEKIVKFSYMEMATLVGL